MSRPSRPSPRTSVEIHSCRSRLVTQSREFAELRHWSRWLARSNLSVQREVAVAKFFEAMGSSGFTFSAARKSAMASSTRPELK